MSNEVLIAIISSASAIGGGLVTIVGNYFTNKAHQKSERKEKDKELLLDLYSEYLRCLQKMINDSNSFNFDTFSELCNRIKILGGDKVVNIVSRYYIDVCDTDNPLTRLQHETYQNKIINAMRKEVNRKKVSGNMGLIANHSNKNN